ncbi:MAG: hypothetical protein Q4B09_02740 [Lachnospiraceae bacterium]|nr:hypothetical protein [Lachnospiraceae bacterium]
MSQQEFEPGSIEWFLNKDEGTPEQKELKRKAWHYMEYGAYDQALRILWKHFPEEYPIPDYEREMYNELFAEDD